ncbi:hypothetical protein [Roseovarius sp. EL26]|uniref:hypothetical protein n=1 Tax=Roseovarius sp. EL26 TaxID=2126672 RepID=UPI000EA3A26D|nr:hypothetical protein [Roseovarius sp. EL26]
MLKRSGIKTVVPFLTLIFLSIIVFGGFGRFLAFGLFWGNRLGAPYWFVLAIFSLVISYLIVYLIVLRLPKAEYGECAQRSISISIFVILPVAFVGIYAEVLRRQAIAEFEPDRVFQNLFWVSLHNAPRDWQFYLHAGAMKDCVPYAWSYRAMGMYELKESVMFNVLPSKWFDECGIKPYYLE